MKHAKKHCGKQLACHHPCCCTYSRHVCLYVFVGFEVCVCASICQWCFDIVVASLTASSTAYTVRGKASRIHRTHTQTHNSTSIYGYQHQISLLCVQLTIVVRFACPELSQNLPIHTYIHTYTQSHAHKFPSTLPTRVCPPPSTPPPLGTHTHTHGSVANKQVLADDSASSTIVQKQRNIRLSVPSTSWGFEFIVVCNTARFHWGYVHSICRHTHINMFFFVVGQTKCIQTQMHFCLFNNKCYFQIKYI